MAARVSAAAAIEAEEFDGLMALVAPFENPPELAVAVSGGADSMALCILAEEWARRRDGRVVALIVDHGLRPESGDESRATADRLAVRDVASVVLTWEGPKPETNVQAAAREARYRLMTDWCRDAGVLHLLLAHHRDDQAETVLLRLGRDSGVDGLAAMAAISEGPAVRLLRPLLGVSKRRLVATLRARGVSWVEDPSNIDPVFARPRLRALSPALAAAGLTAPRLARMARALGCARAALEVASADLLAIAATVHPAGFCIFDPRPYRAAPDAVARHALVRVLLCVGGRVYPPRSARLERLHRALRRDRLSGGRTLGGCRILTRRNNILVCRETAMAATSAALETGTPTEWDKRYLVSVALRGSTGASGYSVRCLGRAGWLAVKAADARLSKSPIPAAARPGLPALFDLDGVAAVPHLEFVRSELCGPADPHFTAVFRPAQPLTPPAFAFAAPQR